MKTWIKRTLLGLLGATVLVGGLSACGHQRHAWSATMSPQAYAQSRDKLVDRVAGKLDLNAEQKQRLSTLGDKVFEQRQALIGQTTDPRAEFRALLSSDKFDRTRAQALITEKTAALQDKSPAVVAALADFYDSLNPTQQQKVRAYLEGRHRGWGRS